MENIIRLSVYACLFQFSHTERHKSRDITKQMPMSKMKAVDWSSYAAVIYPSYSMRTFLSTLLAATKIVILYDRMHKGYVTHYKGKSGTHMNTRTGSFLFQVFDEMAAHSHTFVTLQDHTECEKKQKTADCSFWEHLDSTWCLLLYFINYWFVHTTLFISAKHFEGWTSRWYENMDWQERIFCTSALWSASWTQQWVAVKCSTWKLFECEGLFHALWLSPSTVLVHTVAT